MLVSAEPCSKAEKLSSPLVGLWREEEEEEVAAAPRNSMLLLPLPTM